MAAINVNILYHWHVLYQITSGSPLYRCVIIIIIVHFHYYYYNTAKVKCKALVVKWLTLFRFSKRFIHCHDWFIRFIPFLFILYQIFKFIIMISAPAIYSQYSDETLGNWSRSAPLFLKINRPSSGRPKLWQLSCTTY